MILQIKRGNRVIAESADFSYSPSLQEVRKLTCEVVSVVPIEFKAYNSKSESEYDTVVYNGNTFILYQAPSGDNLNEAGKYKYSLLFYGKEVLLQNVAFLDIVSGTGGEINKIRYTHGGLFQFWGDAKQLAARIEANIESYNASLGVGYTGIGTWTLNVDAEGELTEDMIDITDGTNLFEALKNFYDKFYLNYYFSTTANGGIITITDKTRPSVNWTFKQGDGGGAVKVSSSVDTSTPVITRIIPQGGSRNVPPEYKKDAKPADESRYCPYILLPNDSAGNIRYYIDSEYGLKNYGVRGKTISNTFSGIYPSIRGKKLGDLYPSGLPEWDTYKADGEPDPQSGKVAGEGASASTRIDKIIGSTPIKSDDSDSFFIYMTSPGFNLGYKVYEDGDSSDKINDNVQPQYKPHALFDNYRDFESFDIYGTRAYYDQPVKVTATFSGKMLFSILPIGSDAVGKKVKINLRMVLNRVLGQASPLKEVVIGEEGATGMLEIPYDKTALVGYIEKGQNTTVTIRVEFTFDSDVPAGSCKIGFSEEMTCNIHFGNQDGSQDRFYYKYASVTDAVFSMRTGTYTGTEFKINKNGIIPLYGEVNGDTGETEEDVAMFNKGARYKISCYRTDSDNAKLPLYTDGKSPSIAAGTEFVILNIVMPESYVTMAENTLEKAALDYLSRYDHENRTVSLDISSGFVAEHPNLFIDFIEGNMLKVRDDGIGVFDFSDNGQIVDMQLQIQSLEIKYSKENMFPSYSCTIARRKILSFYERLAQENQTASTQNTTNVTLGGSGTGSGTNIFSEQLLNDLIASFQKFNGWFEWDEVNQALRCKSAFYTNQWISALGAQSGSGEPGGGEGGLIKAVYGFADLGKTFDDSNLSNTFNAYTINEIWKLAKEGGMNTDKLWQELGKDDPTKKIHISHLPDNKFVTLDTEQTVTASKIFTGQLSTANVVPSVNNASTLGLESKRWENIYAVDANISGTVKTQALQVGDIKIIYDSVNKAVTFEHIDGSTEIGFYTRGWISALGVSPGGSGGSGGDGLVKNVYGFSNLGTTFSDSDLDNTFNAYTINEIWKMAKEGGGIKNITQSGSGNAVTNMALSSDGKTITAVFGETFARQQDLGTLNNTVTQLSNKLNNFLEGSDADNIINKWKELEAFLDGLTESDNLAELLALKADKTITISAGTGLTGGGNLSANRTLSLATTGVNAGTYTKVTVDTYGRVTVGDNPTTLAGYGITDAVTLTTAQTISGQKTFTKNILMNSGIGLSYGGNTVFRNTTGNTVISSYGNEGMIYFRPNGDTSDVGVIQINKQGHLNGVSAGFTGGVSAARLTANEYIQIGDAQLVYDSANKALRVKHRTDGNTVGFYSDGWVSALGVKTGGIGGGSGVVNTVYSFANLTDGTTFSDSDLDNTFNAYTIKKLYDMAGQGGLDADAMWAELKKADSSKVIDASHIPTSVLDGRWVKKAGDTMTGTLTSASTSGAIVFKGVENCDITNIYKDNGVIKNVDGGLTSIRNGLRFNWYDTYWYIGNLRGSSTDSAGFGVVDHNNKLVLRVTPNDVSAPRFMSTVATGLSPLIVSSNTTVDNLSADLLDGYHAFGTSNALIKYGYTVGGTEPAWCRIATYSIRNTETMTDVCFVLHSSFSDLFGLLVVKTRGTAVVEGLLIASYNINRLNIRIYHDAEKKNIELYCYGGSNYSIIQANLLYSHDRNGGANTNITLYRADTKAPSWSTYVNPGFVNLQNSSEVAKKLQTPRTLWGQSFDGTANVSGNMTGVGDITMSGALHIGDATSPNTIYFYGTTGDGPGGYNHTFIAERFWGGTESGELVLFKGNDLSPSDTDATTVGGAGPDRIRHIAAAHLFQTYASPISGSVESICTSSALRNLFSIAPGRVVSYIPLQSIVASGTAPFIVASNTVVGNLNADLLDGLHENSFLRHRDTYGIDGYNTLWAQIGIRQYNNAKPDGMANPIYNYGAVVSLPASGPRLDIWYNHTSSASDYNTNGIQYRSGFNDDKKPWRMLLDSVNYASYSDGRYVKKAGDTMTGDLNISGGHILYMLQTSSTSTQQIHFQGGRNDYGRIAFGGTAENAGWMEIASCDDGNEPIYARQYTGVFTTVKNTLTLLDANGDTVMSNNKGLSVGWGSRQVREGGSWVHGGADAANSDDANLRFGSWMGIGWYPTISGQPVAQGKNAMWLNTRTGVLNVVGGIKESTICIGRVNSTGGYDIAYNGEINRYDHHLFLQHHSGKYLIMCTGGGLAGIGTNSPGEKLHVAGNTRTDGYFKSTVGTGTQPYQCSSTTLNSNLNADMLDNWHLNFLPRNYNNTRTYAVQFALGGEDNGWKKIFACSESGAGPYRSVTVWGRIWYAYGNHAQEEVRYYHFCAIFQMRSGPSASDSNVGNVSNSARLYLPTFAKGMDNIRLVRVGTNNFELQVRQIGSYHNGHIQYQYWANGANVSAWENLQSTSNTSVAVSAGGASTLADSRASSADVLTTSRTLWGRPFNGSANIDGNIDNAAVITSKGGIWLDLKGSSGVAFYAGGSLCAVMNTTGVGIGTSSPSQKLHVAGNIIATGAITAKASSSDIRLKTDIQDYDAMGIIRKFRSVKYHWNNLAKRNSEIFNHKKWNYGLIAQDLLSGGYSQWVSDIFKDYYTIDYERLIPVVWKGLQEVDDEVTRLKKRVRELEKRLGIN